MGSQRISGFLFERYIWLVPLNGKKPENLTKMKGIRNRSIDWAKYSKIKFPDDVMEYLKNLR